MDVVLSFIVVAHNHEKCIARCLDSILAQSLRVSYEIIVGDDNSSDRTWTIIEEYGAKYPDTIIIYRVNSNDCNPITLSDRASYNRGHAYNLLRGKYYAEVDGDDFLLPGDTYQKQVDLLESHPDCWLCMQNILSLPDGADLSKAQTYRPKDRFENGQIISANDYILHPDWFAQHQSYVYRRNKTISPIDSLGLDYEDTTATLFHLQFGSIICLNQSGYVWVNYGNGINGSLLFFTSSSYTRGRMMYSVYSATKAAFVNFVQALAEEWYSYGVRVNCINPERTKTPMRIKNFGNEPEGTLLDPKYVATASLNVVFSNYTGEVFDVRRRK